MLYSEASTADEDTALVASSETACSGAVGPEASDAPATAPFRQMLAQP